MQNIDWPEIRKRIESLTTSGLARMDFPHLIEKPTAAEATQQMENVLHASEVIRSGIRPHSESLDLFENWWRRLNKKATLQVIELKDVRSFCLESIAARETFQDFHNSWCQNLHETLMDATRPLSAIDQLITSSGEIRSDASETLDRLFREKESLARAIQNQLDKLVRSHEMENYLQDKYVTTREGRWVLPIKSGHQTWVGGVIHGSSQSKQTVFLEPEAIIPQNNRLRQVETEIEAEIERLLIELSNFLATLTDDFRSTQTLLLECDRVLALAQFHVSVDSQKFSFASEIDLTNLVHPLMAIKEPKPVPNSLKLKSGSRVLLLSGPNAGGKTVLLKSLGLAAHMARCGLPICAAEGSCLPYFKEISAVVGDNQSVEGDLSTFASHLKQLKHASEVTQQPHLILVDEICGSTDPEEGAALARSLIELFAEKGDFALITSHLSPLKSGWDSKVLCGSMEFDNKSNLPTYHFLPGVSGDSLALQTAERVGFTRRILDRALEFLSPASRLKLSQLDEVEKIKTDLKALREHLEGELQEAKQEKFKLQKKLERFEQEKSEQLEKVKKEAQQQVDELIRLAKTEQTFRKHAALSEVQRKIPQIIKAPVGPAVTAAPASAEEFAKAFPSGSRVFVPSLNSDGIVQSAPNSKGMVFVMAQSMRLQLDWNELKPPQVAANPTAQVLRRAIPTASLPQDEHELDLRGKTVDEALSLLESELDLCLRGRVDRLKVIHGYGTEALKKAVRAQLSRSSYVKKWSSGSAQQGGDGITWVELEL